MLYKGIQQWLCYITWNSAVTPLYHREFNSDSATSQEVQLWLQYITENPAVSPLYHREFNNDSAISQRIQQWLRCITWNSTVTPLYYKEFTSDSATLPCKRSLSTSGYIHVRQSYVLTYCVLRTANILCCQYFARPTTEFSRLCTIHII